MSDLILISVEKNREDKITNKETGGKKREVKHVEFYLPTSAKTAEEQRESGD